MPARMMLAIMSPPMARKPVETDYRRLVWDRMEGIAYPGEHTNLFGHERARKLVCDAYASGKMHHAWLVSGQHGIGKATFALTLAGHILRNGGPANTSSEWTAPQIDDPVMSQIGKGGHPNLLQLSRPWDSKKKAFRSSLTVEEIRRTVSFFGTTSGENNWRICIIDTADDMTNSAANALLKILEEPPHQTIFFVLAHSAGRLLPTIRSRCRHLPLRALGDDDLRQALVALGYDVGDMSENDWHSLSRLSGGSVRAALVILQQDGLRILRQFEDILQPDSQKVPNWPAIHKLADELSLKKRQDQYHLLFDFARNHIGKLIHEGATQIGTDKGKGNNSTLSNLARMCEVWDKTMQSANQAESYNLDKKQVILNLFGALVSFR